MTTKVTKERSRRLIIESNKDEVWEYLQEALDTFLEENVSNVQVKPVYDELREIQQAAWDLW